MNNLEPMTKDELIMKLLQLQNTETRGIEENEEVLEEFENLLLQYINDEEISNVYRTSKRWHT